MEAERSVGKLLQQPGTRDDGVWTRVMAVGEEEEGRFGIYFEVRAGAR